MKHLIIIIGTILLGVFIFQMIAGDSPESMKNTVKILMERNIAAWAE